MHGLDFNNAIWRRIRNGLHGDVLVGSLWSLRGNWFHEVAWKCAELAGPLWRSDVPSIVALFHDLDDVSSAELQFVNVPRRVLVQHSVAAEQPSSTVVNVYISMTLRKQRVTLTTLFNS